MAVLGEGVHHFGPAGRGGDRHDFAAGHGDIVRIVLAEVEQVAQHLPLDRGKIAAGEGFFLAVAFMFVDDAFDLRAKRLIAVVLEKSPKYTPERAGTVPVSRAGLGVAAIVGHRPVLPL